MTPESSRSPSRGQLLAIAGLAVAIALVVVVAIRMVFVLFAGVLFALVLRAAAKWLARVTRLPYLALLAAIVVFGVGAFAVAVAFLVPKLTAQIEAFSHDFPKTLDAIRGRLQRLPFLGHLAQSGSIARFDPKAFGKGALAALGGTVEVMSGLVIAFFIGVYGAAQPETYSRAALSVTPKRYERHVERALSETAHNLERWLWGRILAMVFVGITTSITFHVLSIPLALTLGLFAGLLTFIEYAGAIISAVPPVLLGFAQSSSTGLAVLVAYAVLHVIEGYVITPLLARASVHLPPALTLSLQALLGELTGVLGLTFSTPLFVVGVSAVHAFREESKRHSSPEPAGTRDSGHALRRTRGAGAR